MEYSKSFSSGEKVLKQIEKYSKCSRSFKKVAKKLFVRKRKSFIKRNFKKYSKGKIHFNCKCLSIGVDNVSVNLASRTAFEK